MSATGDFPLSAASGSQREADGFTLLEVLVVIAVLALVSGLLFPRVERTVENVQFASARSAVQAATLAARAEAARTDSTVLLQPSNDGRTLLSNGRAIASLPPSIRVQSDAEGLRFFGDGSAGGGSLNVIAPRGQAELLIADGTGVARWRQ
jgi:prepilin-type N-terminal cleavage/methylation domain-containing protein